MIAHYRTNPHFSWYSQVPARKIARILGEKYRPGLKDMYLMFPTSIEHAPLKVRPDGSFNLDAIPPQTLEKLQHTIVQQQRRVRQLMEK